MGRMSRLARHAPSALLSFLAAVLTAAAQTPCEELKRLQLPGTTVTLAQVVPAQPPSPQSGVHELDLPAHCRVSITLKPSSDSEIKAELWLPAGTAWNGKLLGVGGGGFVGSINTGGLASGLREGYATASTDTGHEGSSGEFALGHPEKVIDFAYRAVHEMTVASKAIIKAHYGRGARFAYFQGCSTGGRQGLMEAQRYPEDYDGILAGAPAHTQIELCGWRMAIMRSVLMDPSKALPPEKTAVVTKAVLAQCDALDGVKDGLLADPRKCRFDPETLLCKGGAQDGCLTAPQVETVKMAYADARKKNGELIYPGLVPGGETGWLLPGRATEPGGIDLGMFRYIAHQNAAWDWRSFDLERDTELALRTAGFMHATNPDLSAFKARGGKLLLYHGWSDGGSGGAISPLSTIRYYETVLDKMGRNQDAWLRLFMVPGMAHCGGGSGPNQFNALAALERWREANVAPDRILAVRVANNRVDMTRPLCPYPQVAVYRGSGSTSDAANFTCKVP